MYSKTSVRSRPSRPKTECGGIDYDKAMEVIRQALAGKNVGPSWRCVTCGEVIEGQFSQCWRCGSERPD